MDIERKNQGIKHKTRMRDSNAKNLKIIPVIPAAAAARGAMALCYLLAMLVRVSSSSLSHGQFFKERASVLVDEELHVSALYTMGDSSVDCGDNTLFYPLLHHNLSLLPCNGSDSTLLPYLLAEKMGLSNPPLFYGQNGSIGGLQKGLNYGSAQATILNSGRKSQYQSLNQQLRQALETFQLLRLYLGENDAQHFIKSSVFFLSFGKDDYIDLFLGNSSGVMIRYSAQEFAYILVNQMVHAIRSLYNGNVRKIICMGVLPLGCTPGTMWEWYNSTAINDGSGCIVEINELVSQYNTMLEEQIIELNAELPNAQIIFCDAYQGVMEVVTNPSLYGFVDAKNACCGLGLHHAVIGCLSEDMACSQSSAYVWWDLYNPTQALNILLADSAWSGHMLSSICRPVTVQDLVYASV